MINPRYFLCLSATLLCLSVSFWGDAFGYSAQGHEGIAAFAHENLTDQTRDIVDDIIGNDSHIDVLIQALNENKKIVRPKSHEGPDTEEFDLPTDDFAKVAEWADDVKFADRHQGPLNGNADAIAFNKTWPNNSNWHFLNLPLGMPTFLDQIDAFTTDTNNVVDAIKAAINVLEGKDSGFNGPNFTEAQALYLIAHLVGDLHQPLHVGTGYYLNAANTGDTPQLQTDPNQCVDDQGKPLPMDIGGNSIKYTKTEELHAYWDDTLVQLYTAGDQKGKDKSTEDLVAKMTADHQAGSDADDQSYDPSSDYHTWPAQWATDSVHQSIHVYEGVNFGTITVSGDKVTFSATLDDQYGANHVQLAGSQLRKGGLHLADLLNHIQWTHQVAKK